MVAGLHPTTRTPERFKSKTPASDTPAVMTLDALSPGILSVPFGERPATLAGGPVVGQRQGEEPP